MRYRWRILTPEELIERKRSGKSYFTSEDSWRDQCELVRACVLEVLSPQGVWEEVPVEDPS